MLADITNVPYESLSVVAVLCIGIGVLFKLYTKQNKQIEDLQTQAVTKAEERADSAEERTKTLAVIVEQNTAATKANTKSSQEMSDTFRDTTVLLNRVLDKQE